MTPRRTLLLLTAMLLTAFPGCGSDRPDTVPVSGKVTYQGKAVEGARVMFMATGATTAQAPPATGETDTEGRFSLMTFEPGDGAAVGSYTVLITKRQEVPDPKQPNSPYKVTRDLLPPRFGNASQTDLKAEVKSGAENDFPFDLGG